MRGTPPSRTIRVRPRSSRAVTPGAAPELVEVKLTSRETIELNSKDSYLAFVHGHFVAGTFAQTAHGWTFRPFWGTSIQYDEPGKNASSWKKLWRIAGPLSRQLEDGARAEQKERERRQREDELERHRQEEEEEFEWSHDYGDYSDVQ